MDKRLHDGIKVLAFIAIIVSVASLLNYSLGYKTIFIKPDFAKMQLPDQFKVLLEKAFYVNFYVNLVFLVLWVAFLISGIGVLKLKKSFSYLMAVIPGVMLALHIFSIVYGKMLFSGQPGFRTNLTFDPYVFTLFIYIWYFLRKNTKELFNGAE